MSGLFIVAIALIVLTLTYVQLPEEQKLQKLLIRALLLFALLAAAITMLLSCPFSSRLYGPS